MLGQSRPKTFPAFPTFPVVGILTMGNEGNVGKDFPVNDPVSSNNYVRSRGVEMADGMPGSG